MDSRYLYFLGKGCATYGQGPHAASPLAIHKLSNHDFECEKRRMLLNSQGVIVEAIAFF